MDVRPLKVLLIADYPGDHQQSQHHFAELLVSSVSPQVKAEILRPSYIFGRFPIRSESARKWLSYIDRYVIFPFVARWKARSFDVVHICDPINAPLLWLFSRVPHVITCHDVISIRTARGTLGGPATGFFGRVYQRLIYNGLASARRTICVSSATADDLIELGGIRPDRIGLVENGLNYPYAPMPANEAWMRLSRLGIPEGERFFLHVGGNQWYKNRLGVINIFAAFRRRCAASNVSLILAGKPWSPEMRTLVTDLGLAPSVRQLTDLTNVDLQALYSVAQALIFPSLIEGFGWPVIEAQACGCPVFTSARKPLLHIGGEAAKYLDPEDYEGAASVIKSSLGELDRMRLEGFENVRRFETSRMIDGYIREYRRAFSEQRVSGK